MNVPNAPDTEELLQLASRGDESAKEQLLARHLHQGVALRWVTCWAFGPNDSRFCEEAAALQSLSNKPSAGKEQQMQ